VYCPHLRPTNSNKSSSIIIASRNKPIRRAALASIALLCLGSLPALPAWADGVTAYLPLNLEPEVERQIERVMILADEPILKRPIAIELVKLALPQACKRDKVLCEKVQRYLVRYSHDYGITHASATLAKTHGAETTLPNSYGMQSTSNWEVSLQSYVQPSDYLLLTGGVIAYEGRTEPTPDLSIGFNWAQLDVGVRPHWFSPGTDASMIMSTEAPTTPSATLSNWEPLGGLGFQYELFLTKLNQTGSNSGDSLPGDNILFNGIASRGNPKLFGTQFSVEPFPGWSLGVNRVLEYGGGSGLPENAHFLAKDFFKPSGSSQNEGNQEASYVSRFIFPGKTPFAVYFQYAGEENSDGGSYLLGNAAMLAGIDFPRIWHNFDLTYEISEWQNIWYIHYIFLDGMTSDGFVLGNWGADQRNFNDGVGARAQMLRIGWEPPFGGYLQERVRTVANETYYGSAGRVYSPSNPPAYPYHHYYDASIMYSRPWNGVTVGGEILAGRDVYGQTFSRLSGFVRYGGGDEHVRDDSTSDDEESETDSTGGELFADAGVNFSEVKIELQRELPQTNTTPGVGPHAALGARRAVSDRNDLGVRVEFDEVASHSLIGFRALDYRHRFGDKFALGLFAGVDRYNLETPAYSIYGGVGLQWRNFMPRLLPQWDLNFDFKYGQNIARDHVFPTDPAGSRPESFYKIESGVLYLSRRF
jgi:hypothetical protein